MQKWFIDTDVDFECEDQRDEDSFLCHMQHIEAPTIKHALELAHAGALADDHAETGRPWDDLQVYVTGINGMSIDSYTVEELLALEEIPCPPTPESSDAFVSTPWRELPYLLVENNRGIMLDKPPQELIDLVDAA